MKEGGHTGKPDGGPCADGRRASHEPEDGEDGSLEVKEGCTDEVHFGRNDRGEEEVVSATLFAALWMVGVAWKD